MLQTMDNGYANVTALFRNATGTFKFDDSGKTLSDLKIAVDTTSLIADNDITQRSFSTMIGSFAAPEMRILAPDAVTFNDGKAEVKA
ncbi:hypothetical protein, partial [Escherichia coli]|uniref:hypothetical protein n=1 Tax=Escherichia coli TaxID=562 RepID=UPI0039E17119